MWRFPDITIEQAERLAARLAMALRKAEAKAQKAEAKAQKAAPVRVRLEQLSTVGRLALRGWRA